MGVERVRAGLALSACSVCLMAGCVAKRVVPPVRVPTPAVEPADLAAVTLYLRNVAVDGQSENDTESDVRLLRHAVMEHLRRYLLVRDLIDVQQFAGQPALPAIFLDVTFSVGHDPGRTYLFDLLFFYPFIGFFPFTPEWGSPRVQITATGVDLQGKRVVTADVEGEDGYWMLWYSWYRTAPIEMAYRAAYEQALAALGEALVAKREEILAALESATPAPIARAPAGPQRKVAVLPTQFDRSSVAEVPQLFDDYLLAAVQNAGPYQVVGQSDINALLGFERQKDLIGCTDASCMADIGGALGVDLIVVVQIARMGGDWVLTAKLINIRAAEVEARVSDIVSGEVKELLQHIPRSVGKLMAPGAS